MGDLKVSGAAASSVNGTYHPDGTHIGFSRWKHESKDIWLRIGSGEVWRFVDSPDGSILDGKSTKTCYYYSGEIYDFGVVRNPWEIEWLDLEDSNFPDLKVNLLNQVAIQISMRKKPITIISYRSKFSVAIRKGNWYPC